MHNCIGNMAELFPRHWYDYAHEIVCIDFNHVPTPLRVGLRFREIRVFCCSYNVFFEFMMWERVDSCLTLFCGYVTQHFCCCTKIRRGFDPPHLEGSQYHELNLFAFLLWEWEYAGKVPLFLCCTIHLPETEIYVPFCHKYFCIVVCLCKCVNDTG
jgi:hypothetical protein